MKCAFHLQKYCCGVRGRHPWWSKGNAGDVSARGEAAPLTPHRQCASWQDYSGSCQVQIARPRNHLPPIETLKIRRHYELGLHGPEGLNIDVILFVERRKHRVQHGFQTPPARFGHQLRRTSTDRMPSRSTSGGRCSYTLNINSTRWSNGRNGRGRSGLGLGLDSCVLTHTSYPGSVARSSLFLAFSFGGCDELGSVYIVAARNQGGMGWAH